ncbi:MAG: Crp/Fnr family transcriptional regulator [Elusimicrobiota bacterium]|nr:MAG: Crp/Fnr family transcriptional regulator [Elusimicrobiota bacterium]
MSGARLLKKIPFLSALSPKHLNEVYRLADELEVSPRQSVFAKRQDSDAMFIVLSGRIKIFTNSSSKKRKTFAYLKEGEFFGEMSLLEGTTRTAAAQAVEPSRLLVIRKKDFQRLLAADPKLAMYLLRTVCERLRRANEEIEGLLFRNILGRVAKAMLELGKKSGVADGAGILLKERYTQQELADVVGTTREPLTRALSSLRRAGLVEQKDGRYAIPAPDKLAGLCVEA